MAYCVRCGRPMGSGMSFCPHCGAPTHDEAAPAGSRREVVWEGKLHKCPSCGAPVPTLATTCPSCGYEFRTSGASESLGFLASQLAKVGSGFDDASLAKRAEIVRNYVIPNNKADIFEFLMLAESNIDYGLEADAATGPAQRQLNKAWAEKYKQAYKKAKLLFSDDPQFPILRQAYEAHLKERGKARLAAGLGRAGKTSASWLLGVLRHSIPLIIGVALFVWSMHAGSPEDTAIGMLCTILLLISAFMAGGKSCGLVEIALNAAAVVGTIVISGQLEAHGSAHYASMNSWYLLTGFVILFILVIQAIRLAARK